MTHATPSLIERIEAWFRDHQDGDFVFLPADHPSSRSGDPQSAKTIVYTTKHPCLARIKDLSEFGPIAIIARPGLPLALDLPFVRGHSPSRVFFGDADPPDILTFAWIREHVPIQWHGVNDEFLHRHNVREASWIRVRMSSEERETVDMLPQLCPDFRMLLGEYCSSLLDDGFKIELEGATIY